MKGTEEYYQEQIDSAYEGGRKAERERIIKKWQVRHDDLMRRAREHFEKGENLGGVRLMEAAGPYLTAIELLKEEL